MSVIYYNNFVIELVSVMTERPEEHDIYFIVKNVVIEEYTTKKCHNIRIRDIL